MYLEPQQQVLYWCLMLYFVIDMSKHVTNGIKNKYTECKKRNNFGSKLYCYIVETFHPVDEEL